jgi:hypothetical protein
MAGTWPTRWWARATWIWCSCSGRTRPPCATTITPGARALRSASSSWRRSGTGRSPGVLETCWLPPHHANRPMPRFSTGGGCIPTPRRVQSNSTTGSSRSARVDIRGLLGSVHVPVLVLHRTGDRLADVHASRYMAQRLPNARLVELPGHDHFPFFGDQDTVIELTQEFLTGALPVADPDRILATVLFTDIVDSTRVAAELGDRRWHRVLEEHHQAVRRIWRDFVVARSRRPGMGSWPPLTARPEPSARPMPSGPSWPSTACRSGPACTPGNASCSTTTSGASRCTSPPVSWHRPVTGRSCAHGGQGPGRRGRLRVHQPWHPPAQRRAG